MAEASVQSLLDNLRSLIRAEIGLVLGVNAEMNKLSSNLTAIQAVLEDAEDKQLENKAIRDWLRKLNDLSYEIEDVLDECVTELAKLEYQNRISKVLSVKKLLYKRKIGRRMKEVTAKLDIVVAERANFRLHETTVVLQGKVPAMRQSGSVLNELHHVYGRDEEKEKIVDILVNQVRDREELSILPVVGVGGLGKTTFAQLVFNDDRIVEHFDVKLWVCVSDDFDQMTLIKAMLESVTRSGSGSNLAHLDSLQHSLVQELVGKKYLLVLDDVWNEDQDKWWMFKDLLTCGSAGSSIIVTTRLKKVADIMSTVPAHYLEGLSEESCWLLFKQRAFAAGEEEHSKLESIGSQIVRKCGGVPLAAKALGGLLRFKRKEDEWIHVNASEMWKLPQEESSILPALRLSYRHLPFSLRRCFAYCAIFPKDTRIKKDELVLHWIAQGYVSSNGSLNEETIGDEIFNELVLRSMFQNVEIDDYDGHVSFQMHDLFHDLAQSIMENRVPGEPSEFDDRRIPDANNIRHVDLLRKFVAFPTSTLPDLDLTSILEKFIGLRVLDASYSSIPEVPSVIGNLKHVRYLNLSNTPISTLPDSFCCLWNLKVLNLSDCRKLVCLPKNMRRLRNLRQLFLNWCPLMSRMPPKMGELKFLKTLGMFIISQGKYNQLGELQFLDLGGDLSIVHLERVEDPADAKKANLVKKPKLRQLTFMWETDHSCQSVKVKEEKVLEALEPHPNVEKLRIEGFRGEKFPHWMGSYSTLENLFMLSLSDCPNCPILPPVLGELPHLKELFLDNLGVEYIIEDVTQRLSLTKPRFPSLELLSLWNLPRLKDLLKEETGVVFPILQDLTARGCPLFTLPHLSSIRKLYCNRMVLPSFHKLDNLTTLWVYFDMDMTPIPKEALQGLINLKSLTILRGNEHSLPEEGLQGLKSLTSLDIRGFDTLTCLPERWLLNLAALDDLKLYVLLELVEIPEAIKCLNNLRTLSLMRLPKMKCLPDALQHLTSLQRLYLYDLSQLASLPDWLGNLTSLASMSIRQCPKLVSFPDSIRKLGKLRRLSIIRCPELWRRCEKGNGEEWHKIRHIPYLSNRED